MVWLPSKIDAWWFYVVLLDLRRLQLGSAKPLVSSPFSFLFLVLVRWICATICNSLWFPFFFSVEQCILITILQTVRLVGCLWPVLICSKRKVLLVGY
jgi:hypothetical protein